MCSEAAQMYTNNRTMMSTEFGFNKNDVALDK